MVREAIMSRNNRELMSAFLIVVLSVLLVVIGLIGVQLKDENDVLRDRVIRAEQRADKAEATMREFVAAGVML